jgi:hypothetical protein
LGVRTPVKYNILSTLCSFEVEDYMMPELLNLYTEIYKTGAYFIPFQNNPTPN